MRTSGAQSAATPPSGFRAALVLAVVLTVPAVYLVGVGDLSAQDALVRFGCAWAFAAGGVALVLSSGGTSSVPVAPAPSSAADSDEPALAGHSSGGRET